VHIAVMGAGHVGLVCATGLASIGHRVSVEDVDRERIAELSKGRVPFFELGLQALTDHALASGRLTIHEDPADALPAADVIFMCVPTMDGGDLPDLSRIVAATTAVARYASDDAVLVNRTTSPIGTLQMIRTLLNDEGAASIHVAANPEFLAEGSAVSDFLAPRRVVVGAWEQDAVAPVVEAYRPITSGALPADVRRIVGIREVAYPIPVLVTTPETAEVAKYSANAFLAVKVSFINEVAGLSERFGADIDDVARSLALDPRIGPEFLRPGLGWGPGGFPRDVIALNADAETERVSARMLTAANQVNDDQRCWVIDTLQTHLRTLEGRRIALLGLSFKPSTDDTRSSAALEVARELAGAGAHVVAYDPVVTELPPQYDGIVEIAGDVLAAAAGSDALVLATEWELFDDMPLSQVRSVMRIPLLLDGRNAVDAMAARAAGLVYLGVGKRDMNVHTILPSPSRIAAGHDRIVRLPPSGDAPADEQPRGDAPHEEASARYPVAQAVMVSGGDSEPVILDDWVEPVPLPDDLPRLLRRRPLQGLVKRTVDVAVSFTMLVALLPLVVLVAAGIAMDSRGPVLFVQRRIGRGGRIFPLLKFRTMVTDGEAVLAAHFESNSEMLIEWEQYRKLRDDPRVTRIGSFLRRYSVDELPQIMNVLRGHMSLVGPRPVTTDELELLGERGPQIVSVRPGLTGLWAVSGRSDISYSERAQLEHRYAQEWNLWLDLKILARTVPTVLRGRGAY
jgi:UDPglucose 6-dehydrogenase